MEEAVRVPLTWFYHAKYTSKAMIDCLNASLARTFVRTAAAVVLSNEPIPDTAEIGADVVAFGGGSHRLEIENMVTGVISGAIVINLPYDRIMQ